MNQDNDNSAKSQSGFSGFGNTNFGTNAQGGNPNNEFGSGFGATNAVSQIFREGSAEDERRKKIIAAAVAVAAMVFCGGAIYWFYSGESAVDESAIVASEEMPAAPALAEAPMSEQLLPAVESMAGASVGSSTWTYNEEEGGPVINVPAGTMVEAARDESFSQMYVYGVARDGSFRIPNPPPGKVYWRTQGASDFNTIEVLSPVSLGLSFSAPSSLSANGQMSWSANGPVAFYRIELATDSSFANVSHVFSTSETQMTMKDVSTGKYHVRLGGFNRASGKWEWTSGSPLDIR